MTLATQTRDANAWRAERLATASPFARILSGAARFAHALLIRFGLIVAVLAVWELALSGRDLFQFKPPSVIFATMYAISSLDAQKLADKPHREIVQYVVSLGTPHGIADLLRKAVRIEPECRSSPSGLQHGVCHLFYPCLT